MTKEKGMMKLDGEEKKFTKEEISALKKLGWEFMPNGPNEYDWMKFNSEGKRISTAGSIAWREDLIKIGVLRR